MRIATAIFVLVVGVTAPLFAQPPTINAAIPDISKGHLWIIGTGFGADPVVTLAGVPAGVFHASAESIGAVIASGVLAQPGTYELKVAFAAVPVATFNVAISSASSLKLTVVDAHDKVVGLMVEAPHPVDPSTTRVSVQGNGTLAIIQVSQNAFRGQEEAVFESEDCTGAPFLKPIFAPGDQLVPSTTTLTADGYLYAVDSEVAPSRPALRSMWKFGFDACEPYVGPYGLFSPTKRVLDLKQFTPPFRVVLR